MLPSGLPADHCASLDVAAPRRDPSVGTSSQNVSNGDDSMRGGQATRGGRRLFFTCPKALAIFHAANAMANHDQYTRTSLLPQPHPKPSSTQENLREQSWRESESSVTLPGPSVSTLADWARTDRAALHQDTWAARPPGADPHAAFTSTSSTPAAADAPSVAPPPADAAMQPQSATAETATSPTPAAPPLWRLGPAEAVPYPSAAHVAVPAPARLPPPGMPSLSAAQAPLPAAPYPVSDPVDSMPSFPEPPPGMPYPTVLPTVAPVPAPAPTPLPAMSYAPAPLSMAPPAVSPHTPFDPVDAAPPSPQPPPVTLFPLAAPAAAPAPPLHPNPLPPLRPPSVATAASPGAPQVVTAPALSAPNCPPPPLPAAPHPAAQPLTSPAVITIHSLPIGLPAAPEPVPALPLPAGPPPALPAQLHAVGTPPPGPEAAVGPEALAPQPQAACPCRASAGVAPNSGTQLLSAAPVPQQQQQQQQPQNQSDGPGEVAAVAAALEACLKPARRLHPEHKEQRVRAVMALAMSRAWDDCAAHYQSQGQGQGPQGHQAAAGAAAPGPGATGALTRLQLLQFGWTTAQLDSLFAAHFPPWPPGRMSYDGVAIMYEKLGSGIGSRGLRQKPGGGGADVVLAPVAGWGAARAAELRRLLQALTPLEQEAQRLSDVNAAQDEAERARAARREALRQLREASVDAAEAGAEAQHGQRVPLPQPRVPREPRLREVLTRVRTYLRLPLRPHLTAKEPRPLPLGDFLRGLSKAALVDLDEETKAGFGVQNAEQLVANWLQDVAEVRRGQDGSVGLVASVAYRLQPDFNYGLHGKKAAPAAPPPGPVLPPRQKQGLVGESRLGSERSGGGGAGACTYQPRRQQQPQRHLQSRPHAAVRADPPCPTGQKSPQAQREPKPPPHPQHPPPHQPGPQRGASGTLSGDGGSGPLDSAGSWPMPSIFPRNPCLPMPNTLPEASGLLPLGPQPSQHTGGGDQAGLRPPSDTRAGSSTTTTTTTAFRADPTAARSAVTDSMGPSAGSSGYLSGATCVASSGSGGNGGDGSYSRPLSSGTGGRGSYCRFEGAASAPVSRRVVDLPPHLRPKTSPQRTSPPTQQQPQPQRLPDPQQRQQQPVCAGSCDLTACAAGAAKAPAGPPPQAAATAVAAGVTGHGAGGSGGAVPLSREERSVRGLPLFLEQWALAQAEALGAECLAACGSAGGGSCWRATIVGPQGPASRWGATRQAAMQALHAALRELCGPNPRS